METNMAPTPHRRWTALQKIAFRFFFVFLTLQVLTENFLGNLFGSTLFIWRLGETIFVQPCLWLNNQFFHFKYIPQSWTTFSGSLHTIRDFIYLLISLLTCILWTVIDRNRMNYDKLNYWFSRCLVIALACISFSYGIVKIFPVQMLSPSLISLHTSVGDLSPFDLIWTTFGYGKPYEVFSGLFEVAGALLILFRRTRVAGLLILGTIMINVIMLNYTYQIGVLILSFYIFLVILFLLAPYTGQLSFFFFKTRPIVLYQHDYVPGTGIKIKLFNIISFLLVCTSFTLTTSSAYNRYERTEAVNHSRQYSIVTNYVINADTLKAIENDTLCWHIWSERIINGKQMVTIAAMKPNVFKTYTLERDTVSHSLILHPSGQADTTTLHFSYAEINKTDWQLEGMIGQKKLHVQLQKIDPGKTMTLLKAKHTIIIFDDESDQE